MYFPTSSYNCSILAHPRAQKSFSARLRVLVSILFLAVLILPIVSCSDDEDYPPPSLTVVSYGGGAYQQSHIDAFCAPYTAITGAEVKSVVWNAEYGKLKTMVDSGKVPWNVVEVTAAQFSRGIKDNLFQKLSVLPSDGTFLEGTVFEYGVANVYWGTVMSYNPNAFDKKRPTSWTDFWDVKTFPGHRALYDDPRGNLEFALLADGISVKDLYPLDVDRAFAKLDQIKPHIRLWWTDGTQPVQALIVGTVAMSSVWNGRLYASEKAKAELEYSWNGAALELDFWVVPRNAQKIDAASRFILFASLPYTLAKQTELVGYGPVNVEALKYVSESARKHLPTYEQNWNTSFVVDAEWWADNEETIKTRWLSWKAK